jgi:8-oxo-dGTP diphosphatase
MPVAIEFPKRLVGVVSVILDDRKHVLLVKSHSYGRLNWELPGGWAESQESLTDTAIREVKEETGLDIGVSRLTGIYYDPDFDMHYFSFLCELRRACLPQPDLGEVIECGYWPIDALPRPINDFTILRITDALSDTNSNCLLPQIINPRKWYD